MASKESTGEPALKIQKRSRGDPIPVTILTGFLGAGKTTLLNHLLSSMEHKMKFAVIENEFGDVGVDEKILVEKAEEQVIEVMNGCICCTVRGDLSKVLKKMHNRIKDFDGVIIETTGLADPAPVAQTFFVEEEVAALYKLDGIITVVDAKHVVQHIEEEKTRGRGERSRGAARFRRSHYVEQNGSCHRRKGARKDREKDQGNQRTCAHFQNEEQHHSSETSSQHRFIRFEAYVGNGSRIFGY